MAISVGEIEATLKLRDELSGGLAKSFAAVQQYAEQFASVLGKVEGAAEGMGKGGEIITTMLGAIPVAAVVAVGALAAVGLELAHLAMKAAAVGDELKDMSYKTSISVPGLSNLKFAAEVAGSNINQVSNAIFMMQKRMQDNPDAFEKGLKKIGLNMEDVKKLHGEEMFLTIARAFRTTSDESNRAGAAMDLMSRQGRDNLPLMMKPLDDLIKKSKELGFTWTDEDAKAAEELEMSSRLLHLEWEKIWVDIGKKFMPALSGLYGYFQLAYEQVTNDVSLYGQLAKVLRSVAAGYDLISGNHGGAPKLPPSAMPIGAGPKPIDLQDNEIEGVIKRSDEAMTKLDELRKKHAAEELKFLTEGIKLKAQLRASDWKQQQQVLDSNGLREIAELTRLYNLDQEALATNVKVDEEMRAAAWKVRSDALNANGLRDLAEIDRQYKLTEAYSKQSLQRTATEAKKTYDYMVANSGDFSKETRDHFKEVADEAQRMALGLRKSLGSDLMENFKAIPGMVAQAFTGGGGIIGAVKGIGSMLSSTLGKHLGESITALGKMGGPIGAAIGSLAGPLIEMFAKMLDHTGKDVRRMGAELGVKLSDGLVEQIKKDAKKFGGEVQGMLVNLDKVINEAGGVAEFGLDKAIAKTHDLFSMLQTGKLTAQQVGTVFDKVFAQMLPLAISKTTGLANAAFLDLIQNARDFGIESKAVTDFLVGQAGNVVTGLNAIAGSITLGKNEQAEFDRVGRLANSTFMALVGTGKSLLDVVTLMGPTLDILSKATTDFGLKATGAVGELLNIRKFVTEHKDVVDALGGINMMLSGLYNLGLLNESTFMDLGAEAYSTFKKMTDGGLTGNQAMALMQPTLQTIWELEQKNGLKVDETTQKLVDQAVEAGIVGEAHKSASERMVDALDKVVTVLESIALFMGVTLPSAAKDGAKGVDDAFSNLHPHINVKVDYSGDVPDNTIGMASGGAGRANGPTWFYSGGNEDFAFSGEGAAFGGGGDNRETLDRLDDMQESIEGLRRDFLFTIPNAMAKATAVAFVKAGK